MPNRSMRDERQRAGAPGRGSLFGKKPPPGSPKTPKASDPATRDLSIVGAARKISGRQRQIDKAVDDAS